MSDKPVIFISHSSKDKELAKYVKKNIKICVRNAEVFASDIDAGENWFDKVMSRLKVAQVIVVLITPNSIRDSHWVWFELGYFWARHDDALESQNQKQRVFYPLYIGVEKSELPNPVNDLKVQAISLIELSEIMNFFQSITRTFDGNDTDLSLDRFVSWMENQNSRYLEDQNVETIQNNNPTNHEYVSPYSHYEEPELKEKIAEYLETERWDAGYQGSNRYNNVYHEMLVIYSDLDKSLKLPLGTSRRLLKLVASQFDLSPIEENTNSIRFSHEPSSDEDDFPSPPRDMNDIPF